MIIDHKDPNDHIMVQQVTQVQSPRKSEYIEQSHPNMGKTRRMKEK